MKVRTILAMAAAVAAAFLLLSIPGRERAVPPPGHRSAFTWNQDAFWQALERSYRERRPAGCPAVDGVARRDLRFLGAAADRLMAQPVGPDASLLDSVESRFFTLGPFIALCPRYTREYLELSGRLRDAIKWQSRRWDVTRDPVRARLYRSLYGVRAAVEEVMLHHPDSLPPLLPGRNEPSATPSAIIHGVEIHSGDILVSRGGYPTSALIARGNDYPGNFSHVALVYVDSATGDASTIEAHIERGVTIATAEQYLNDKKLRILVLRPRADLPALAAEPMLPHRAASRMFHRARRDHIPYDFAMNYTDPSELFCSEVASSAYRDVGVTLWMGMSTLSTPGVRRWLGSFGVRYFETQEPSDLEYDPQLAVVAEWRDPATLMQDHVDNAVLDAMLEGAEAGEELTYPWYRLAPVRIAKGWSWLLGRLGKVGPVPEGMSALAALRNSAFSARQRQLAAQVTVAVDSVQQADGYPPPYWSLLALARTAVRHEADGASGSRGR